VEIEGETADEGPVVGAWAGAEPHIAEFRLNEVIDWCLDLLGAQTDARGLYISDGSERPEIFFRVVPLLTRLCFSERRSAINPAADGEDGFGGELLAVAGRHLKIRAPIEHLDEQTIGGAAGHEGRSRFATLEHAFAGT
jgi:hypothetical protein